jgi:hypothetical protein
MWRKKILTWNDLKMLQHFFHYWFISKDENRRKIQQPLADTHCLCVQNRRGSSESMCSWSTQGKREGRGGIR